MLQVQHLSPASAGHLWGKAHDLPHQRIRLPGNALVSRRQFHMVALPRVGDASPGEERTPEERRLAAVLLHHRQVHMERQCVLRVKAEGFHDRLDFIAVPYLEHQLSRRRKAGVAVEGQIKSFFEQLRQNISKIPAFGDDFNTVSGEIVGKQQNAEALRQSAAMFLGQNPADLRLGGRGKRACHGETTLLMILSYLYQIRTSGSNRMPLF